MEWRLSTKQSLGVTECPVIQVAMYLQKAHLTSHDTEQKPQHRDCCRGECNETIIRNICR